jgi:hypothetical protein
MHRLRTDVTRLQAALLAPVPGNPLSPDIVTEASAFIRGIERKIRFVEHHAAVLSGVQWDQIERIGRRLQGVNHRNHLTINLADASLTIEHADAVIDHVYVAFEGLTAALVNMTDTMGRLINLRYALGIDPRKASLLSLKNHCSASSPLAVVVNDPKHNDWLKKVRELRGRCQHADVESVVVAAAGPYARRGQPVIPSLYCWQTPPTALPILNYAQEAVQAAEATLLAVIASVLQAPSNPLI